MTSSTSAAAIAPTGTPLAREVREFRPTAHPVPKLAAPAADTGAVVSLLQRTEIFRDYLQAFEVATGLPLALRQAGSFQSPLHGSKRLNPFCGLMARGNKSCAACLQLQQRVEQEAIHRPHTLECFAGLSESAVPVRVGDTLVGYLQTGQVFLRAPSKKGLRNVLREIGGTMAQGERRELEAAYFQTRRLTRDQYGAIVQLLTIFAEHLAAVSNQLLCREAAAEPAVITRARAFIAEHQSEDLHLRDVTGAVHMSAFHFCKLFKKTTGLTFTNYLARRRIEAVKQMLQKAHARVTEAAYAAGFQSLSQFNRVFHRIAGESPSSFRDRLHRQTLPPVPAAS